MKKCNGLHTLTIRRNHTKKPATQSSSNKKKSPRSLIALRRFLFIVLGCIHCI